MDCDRKEFTYINDRLVLELRTGLQETNISVLMTKVRPSRSRKTPTKRNHSQQLQTDNVFTYDMDTPNNTVKGGDL